MDGGAFPLSIESVHLVANTEVCGVDTEGFTLHRVASRSCLIHDRERGWSSGIGATTEETIGRAVLGLAGLKR